MNTTQLWTMCGLLYGDHMIQIRIVALMILAILVLIILVEFLVWRYWERKFMTEARKKELETKRLEKHQIKLTRKVWTVTSEIIPIALPFLFIVDGLVIRMGILYSPYLSFFNPFEIYLQIAGLVISFVGFIIMIVSGRTVSEHVYARATEERKMITTGLYAYIRHPLYLSFILVPLGFLLVTLNYLSLLLFAAFTVYTNSDTKECGREGKFTFIIKAARCEEEGLIRIYGKDYEEYMKRTGMLFPRFRK